MTTKLTIFARYSLPVAFGSLAWLAVITANAESPKVVKIEEHWELRVGQPDTETSAPQATMVMSPEAGLDGVYFLVTINHRNVPSYEPGGVQVQMWNQNDVIDSATGSPTTPLDHASDVVRWTERLTLHDGTLTFEVADGSSDSWGQFGNEPGLTLSTSTQLNRLNEYRPANSLNESQVGYAGNRVQSLVLKQLEWWTDDGQVHQLNAPFDIDTDIDP
jgi:hypothetical protein